MKRGIGTSGYEAYIIELKVHFPHIKEPGSWENYHLIQRMILDVKQIIPDQPYGGWGRCQHSNYQWMSLTARSGREPEELYHELCQAIWKSNGYRWIMFEAQPCKVEQGWYASSEEKDFELVKQQGEGS